MAGTAPPAQGEVHLPAYAPPRGEMTRRQARVRSKLTRNTGNCGTRNTQHQPQARVGWAALGAQAHMGPGRSKNDDRKESEAECYCFSKDDGQISNILEVNELALGAARLHIWHTMSV